MTKDPSQPNENRIKKGNRKRKITWFINPYSCNVATNIGKDFFALLDKCFPKSNKLHKIINRNTIKLSFSCTPNMKQLINNHNRTLSKEYHAVKSNPTETKLCNCRNKAECPLDGHCLTTSVIYKATVTQFQNNQQKTYIGLTENTFKTRFNLHTSSFRHSDKRKSTALSEFIWQLKDNNTQFSTKWEIIKKSTPHNENSKRCQLCLDEKLEILKCIKTGHSLNKRRELFNRCMHQNKQPVTGKSSTICQQKTKTSREEMP